MKKKIVIIVVVIILLIGGFFWWFLSEKPEPPPNGTTNGTTKEVFNLSAKVLIVDQKNNSLMVKPIDGSGDIGIIISDMTMLEKLILPPFDPANPPKGTLTPERHDATIADFKKDDYVFIKSNENIADKGVINNIKFIQILP